MWGFLENLILLMAVGFPSEFVSAVPHPYPACRARDTCVKITECRPYIDLIGSLKRPLSSAAVVFLRNQECGFAGDVPLVCCFPDTTTKGQIRRNNLSIKEEQKKVEDFGSNEKTSPQFIISDLSEYKTSFRDGLTTQKITTTTTTTTTKQPTNDQELRDKMESLNKAFAYSTMDYFFFRRMLEKNSA